MQATYLFYDLETSGLSTCFDQVLQFAAIRTDLALNELQRYEFFVKLNPDTIPAPQAFLTHQIPFVTLQAGLCEYEAIGAIHRLFNTPGTITIGYNTLNFDDELLRFSFYRNLLDPYSHQYAHGCYRMDLYPMLLIYHLFKPKILPLPQIQGKTSFKLAHIADYHKIIGCGKAHNAMYDIETTLAIARILQNNDPSTWQYLKSYFDKKTDLQRFNQLATLEDQNLPWLLFDGSMGFERSYQTQALSLGMHAHYSNQSLWLPLDQFRLDTVQPEQLLEKIFVIRKKFGEPPFLLPLHARFAERLANERLQLAAANCQWLKEHPDQQQLLREYHQNYTYPEIPNLDLDAALYQSGFMSNADRVDCNHFHAQEPVQKFAMIEQFTNLQLRSQALRILGRNYSAVAPNHPLLTEFKQHLQQIRDQLSMADYKNQARPSTRETLTTIETLLSRPHDNPAANLSSTERELLQQLAKHIQAL